MAAHGVIGDMATAALVADTGAVDFLCWPRFDGPTIFAALLDPAQGGAWHLRPAAEGPGIGGAGIEESRLQGSPLTGQQRYHPETNVLVTRWTLAEGSAEVLDFLPFDEPGAPPRLVRLVRATRGEVRMTTRCTPRPDYARAVPRARAGPDGVTFAGGGLMLRLTATVPLQATGGDATADFVVRSGDAPAAFILSDEAAPACPADAAPALAAATIAAWQRWARHSTYRGRWREAVTRSALALKLLTSRAHGSLLAAATFGLPERPGGERNWDYRATWIRDASFAVYALMRLGYAEEANAFMRWIHARADRTDSDGSMRIMYAPDGAAPPAEEALAHLSGHLGAGPVRIGNAAQDQVQLDIYGELLDAAYLANKYGDAISHDGWANATHTVEYVCAHWREPDAGIWEVRGPRRHWLHSRVMCWVALDRAVRLAVKRSLPAPIPRWAEERDRIRESVWEEFWDADRGHFVSFRGGDDVDGSMLLMPLVRFVSAKDPRWLATLDAVTRDLTDGPLVWRYRRDDGLRGPEGAFAACSFWYAECLARAGRLDRAQDVFEGALSLATPLGLFAEEFAPDGAPLGNMPQALTHLALISAAVFLDRELSGGKGALWRP
ncbi:glycoside hydrolase family 15 protein [Roseomonas sp. CCTCC AB2023176]|uniref:glycoside hydrolase family 15 protein n=1 Tax=Roseomonas sp. CCTCC AB2023176 TaxID=3342640 RepID=UPI0035E374D9